jgi:Zn-dependent protease
MKWSFKLGEVGGIGVYVHFTFLLLLGWIVLASYEASQELEVAAREGIFILLVFGIIVLHELGHAFAARRYGIATRDITLLPIGGVARLERMPDDPRQELVVALAGPAVNVVLAGILAFVVGPAGTRYAFANLLRMESGSLAIRLLEVNIMLVLFNLIPAFPMDGGRVLRALLAMRGDYVQATQTAASVGQALALLFGFLGLFGLPMLLFIALFVWIGAAQEASMVQVKAALAGIPVSRAMIQHFHVLAPDDSLEVATQHVLAGFQHDFPVVENGKVMGVLTRADLLTALAKAGERGRVRDAMRTHFETADPGEMLEQVMARLQDCECYSMPVVRNGQLLGLITMDSLGEFLLVRNALREARQQGRPVEDLARATSGAPVALGSRQPPA